MPRVLIDVVAEKDLLDIAWYIGVENKSPRAAQRFIDNIQEKFDLIAQFPFMGEARPELGENLRSFPFKKNFVVIYRPLEDGIDVLRVFRASRDYPRFFKGS